VGRNRAATLALGGSGEVIRFTVGGLKGEMMMAVPAAPIQS